MYNKEIEEIENENCFLKGRINSLEKDVERLSRLIDEYCKRN
jgi:cell division protein FtsB